MLPHFLQVKITYAMFILCYKLAMDNLSTILVTNETVTTNKQPVRSESGSIWRRGASSAEVISI